jgi:hypothetical protein
MIDSLEEEHMRREVFTTTRKRIGRDGQNSDNSMIQSDLISNHSPHLRAYEISSNLGDNVSNAGNSKQSAEFVTASKRS